MRGGKRANSSFDISPFALPNCAPGEIRFEETRDVREVVVEFAGAVPPRAGISYLRGNWPRIRAESFADLSSPWSFGWIPADDQFNGRWQKGKVEGRISGKAAVFAFRPLSSELGRKALGCDAVFRRTLGIRVDTPRPEKIKKIRVYTVSPPESPEISVELDAGKKTPGKSVGISGYNASVAGVKGAKTDGKRVVFGPGSRVFKVRAAHMVPAHRHTNDRGLLTFSLDRDAFTISLEALKTSGPVWYQEAGIFIKLSRDPVTFSAYREASRKARTVSREVAARPEQAYLGAFFGQPRPHAVSYNVGFKHARQRFWIEPNGDIVMHRVNVGFGRGGSPAGPDLKGADTDRFKNEGDARIFFGFESWVPAARFVDPPPVPVYNMRFRRGGVLAEQRSFCVPLAGVPRSGEARGDDVMAALVRFRFRNEGNSPVRAELPLSYSPDSSRSYNPYLGAPPRDASLVPQSPKETLSAEGGLIFGPGRTLRMSYESAMEVSREKGGVLFYADLAPGEECGVLLRIPHVALDSESELASLRGLDAESLHAEVTRFWREENLKGSQIRTPVPQLNDLYASHLTHVEMTDFSMPGKSGLINTSVGTSTYGNYSNESCMIIQELDQRGFHDECRRRLDLWARYQGTASQPGNFTDYRGMYFGAGGFESGHYNQHHGWVLWCLAEHYFLTRDDAWWNSVSQSVVDGADWIVRQRRNTMAELAHSRGWEKGFLPAGSLEDVTEFHYWLSTNCLTWRGLDSAARALEQSGHKESARLKAEADAFGADLKKGFETMRQLSPLVRLRDGRWVPHYPSRLYLRGRDIGWIRETLEGAVYLLISGLYPADSREAGWILDDFQDNRYMGPPYGYPQLFPESTFFNRGGFSIQPNLLAGLLPHLCRDEIEAYIWMFLNAWVSCYREEINAMVEHPIPELGYSNSAHFKTSDEANAVMWLRYMFVHWDLETLYLGRAIPRAWLKGMAGVGITKVATPFGKVGASWTPAEDLGTIVLEAEFEESRHPGKILARFRHPEKKRLRSVSVNGKEWKSWDPEKNDVDVTGVKGSIRIEANF